MSDHEWLTSAMQEPAAKEWQRNTEISTLYDVRFADMSREELLFAVGFLMQELQRARKQHLHDVRFLGGIHVSTAPHPARNV